MVQPHVDVVPLFETVRDLIASPVLMDTLCDDSDNRAHITTRGNEQRIVLGFSDGTKDGGYLVANWSIYRAKAALTKVSRARGVVVVFFDGRGGLPARGGGQTHQFYASMGSKIDAKQMQLTVQGQTISSKFGTLESCQYNIKQLISSGVSNAIYATIENDFTQTDHETMEEIAAVSYKAYVDFKEHPLFLKYLKIGASLNTMQKQT